MQGGLSPAPNTAQAHHQDCLWRIKRSGTFADPGGARLGSCLPGPRGPSENIFTPAHCALSGQGVPRGGGVGAPLRMRAGVPEHVIRTV